ncbi:MAG: ABC transporter ATP-binding protein [Comamonadaceae bacterium]|nr:MAG: ABC transporter ATP-binding protein [Comamonadaceae bacterium]
MDQEDTARRTDVAISVSSLRKVYHLYDKPVDRLKQLLLGHRGAQHYREFVALEEISFDLKRGEVLGLVGRNGAGKSTLLQAICGTLTPSSGSVTVNGRVAALLELGAGFNPEFSGRENIYLNAAILGLSREQIDERYDAIVAFADIPGFIEQPVKTYSSGMYVRLAFAIATSVDPDILVVDEALSVGDGAFSRKSFDRIMQLKDGGATILFCSHSTYQVEALCTRALWIEKGRVRMDGIASGVVDAYERSLESGPGDAVSIAGDALDQADDAAPVQPLSGALLEGRARFVGIDAWANGAPLESTDTAQIEACQGGLRVKVRFESDPALPAPTIAYEIQLQGGQTVTSGVTLSDGVVLRPDARGAGEVDLVFDTLPLMRGRYQLTLYLACERMIHVYDHAPACVHFEMTQTGLERGVAFIPHAWRNLPAAASEQRIADSAH